MSLGGSLGRSPLVYSREPVPAREKLPGDSLGHYGSLLTMAIGAGLLVLGLGLLYSGGTTMPLRVALVIGGAAALVLGWYALHRSRVAWAFATAMHGTLFLVFLFGAPKIRDAADISIGLALVPTTLLALAVTLMALSGDDYE